MFRFHVHLPLILRISAKKPHGDAINPLKKFVKVEVKVEFTHDILVCYNESSKGGKEQ